MIYALVYPQAVLPHSDAEVYILNFELVSTLPSTHGEIKSILYLLIEIKPL